MASFVTDVAWLAEVPYVPQPVGGGPTTDQGVSVGASTTVDLAAFVWVSARRKRGEINAVSEQDYRPRLDDFCRHYGTHKPVANVRRRHVEKWLESLERLAPSSRRSYYTTVSMWLRWCHAEGLIDGPDPTLGIRKPREPRTVPRNLSHESIDAAIAHADQRQRTIVLLMVQLGLRRGEVARLRVEDVDLVNRVARIRGKGDHERVLPLPAQVVSELRRHVSAYRLTSGPIIRSHVNEDRGVSPATIGSIVGRLLYDAGVKSHGWDRVSGHSFRHSAAADMLRGGAHVRDVQAVLGHSSIATTERYLPLVVRTLGETVDGRRYG